LVHSKIMRFNVPTALLCFGSLLATSSCSPQAQADETFTFIIKKQEQKKKTRWSLSEWLETKQRISWMDQWLALHSPSPYEFYLAGEWLNPESQQGLRLSVGAYAKIFGLEYSRETTLPDQWQALFKLRIFGYHAQGTNLTLDAGVSSSMGPTPTRQATWGLGMTMYLSQFFGLDGVYRSFLSQTRTGERFEAGAFIDFNFLRVFGNYFHESRFPKRSGTTLGVKLYF
jgi:hypothetical protein